MFQSDVKKSQLESRISTYTTRSAEQTLQLGRRLARLLHGGEVVLLQGPLGAGKSVLARGIAEGLGGDRWLGSPTFNIVHEYDTSPTLIHADLYRLDEREVEVLGLEDYTSPDAVLIVEWPERASEYVAALAVKGAIRIEIIINDVQQRLVRVQGLTIVGLGAAEEVGDA